MQRQVATIRKSQKTDVNPRAQSHDEVADTVDGDPQEQFLDRIDDVPVVLSMNAQ